jgi:hypothetical protein
MAEGAAHSIAVTDEIRVATATRYILLTEELASDRSRPRSSPQPNESPAPIATDCLPLLP